MKKRVGIIIAVLCVLALLPQGSQADDRKQQYAPYEAFDEHGHHTSDVRWMSPGEWRVYCPECGYTYMVRHDRDRYQYWDDGYRDREGRHHNERRRWYRSHDNKFYHRNRRDDYIRYRDQHRDRYPFLRRFPINQYGDQNRREDRRDDRRYDRRDDRRNDQPNYRNRDDRYGNRRNDRPSYRDDRREDRRDDHYNDNRGRGRGRGEDDRRSGRR